MSTIVRRAGPIVVPEMDERIGPNINGPALIRVPDWVERPLGAYYLYFGSHWGTFIRLAYADRIAGPWRIHGPGAFDLSQSAFADHISSPDVVVDDARREIRLYYHGVAGEFSNQKTRVAISTDGLAFTEQPEIILDWYARVFHHGSWWYALTMPGTFWRSKDGLANFERGPTLFTARMRHSAVRRRDDALEIYYTDVGDAPEAILRVELDLRPDWNAWHTSQPVTVLAPEQDYEGGDLPITVSTRGPARERERALRDPAVFEENGRVFIVYSLAGESGLALAEILNEDR